MKARCAVCHKPRNSYEGVVVKIEAVVFMFKTTTGKKMGFK